VELLAKISPEIKSLKIKVTGLRNLFLLTIYSLKIYFLKNLFS